MTWSRSSAGSTWHPGDWPRRRARIKRRDHGRCQWPTSAGICGSTDRIQVDRITPFSEGGSADDINLRCVCHAHHARKTSAEGHRAQARAPRTRAPEQHPGRRSTP